MYIPKKLVESDVTPERDIPHRYIIAVKTGHLERHLANLEAFAASGVSHSNIGFMIDSVLPMELNGCELYVAMLPPLVFEWVDGQEEVELIERSMWLELDGRPAAVEQAGPESKGVFEDLAGLSFL